MGRSSSSKKRSKKGKTGKTPSKKYKSSAGATGKSYSAPSASVKRAARAMLNTTTQGFLGIEKKFYDTALAPTALSVATDATSGECDPSATSMISTPAIGDGEQNRDGKRIVIKSVQVKGFIDLPASMGSALIPLPGVQVFVALVLDTQSNGAQMNSEDCFKNLSGDARNNVCLMRNLLANERFRVLKSQVIELTPNSIAQFDATHVTYNGCSKAFDFFVPLDLPVNFNAGSTSTIAAVVDNSLHVIAFATTNNPSAPTISYNARIRFLP